MWWLLLTDHVHSALVLHEANSCVVGGPHAWQDYDILLATLHDVCIDWYSVAGESASPDNSLHEMGSLREGIVHLETVDSVDFYVWKPEPCRILRIKLDGEELSD